jgi:hypothetical protein
MMAGEEGAVAVLACLGWSGNILQWQKCLCRLPVMAKLINKGAWRMGTADGAVAPAAFTRMADHCCPSQTLLMLCTAQFHVRNITHLCAPNVQTLMQFQ